MYITNSLKTNPCTSNIAQHFRRNSKTVMYETHSWISTLLWEENGGACGGDTQQNRQIINAGDNSPARTR